MPSSNRNREGLDQDPFWYKTGVIYEVHVRAFYDTDADGTGDFRGLTEKLDLGQELRQPSGRLKIALHGLLLLLGEPATAPPCPSDASTASPSGSKGATPPAPASS